jgi:hypothetical protein
MDNLICVVVSLLRDDYQCIDFLHPIIGNGYNILFPSRGASVIDVSTPYRFFLIHPSFQFTVEF